jgi:putative PIN family toxin of toxin-antitoxin system
MPDLRVVLDTNVLVSGLAYPGSIPGRIVTAWQQGWLKVVLSRFILEELVRVLPRLTRVTLNADEIRDLADILLFSAEIVEPNPDVHETVRDRCDDPVLGTLVAAQAEYLITGDKDLLALANRFPILSPAAFWEKHGN